MNNAVAASMIARRIEKAISLFRDGKKR